MRDDAVNWSEVGSMDSTTADSGECPYDDDEEISILCELVGARDLSIHEESRRPIPGQDEA